MGMILMWVVTVPELMKKALRLILWDSSSVELLLCILHSYSKLVRIAILTNMVGHLGDFAI